MSVDIDTFLTAKSLKDLPDEYKSPETAITKWHQLCSEEAEKKLRESDTETPDALDHMSFTISGITYRVYGVLHGWSGGPNREYRNLVNNTLKHEDVILFEKVLGNLYATESKIQIPDFWVLGKLVQFILGFRLCLFFPWLFLVGVIDIIRERFSHNSGKTGIDNIFNSCDYHKLSPEIRRGIGHSLPTTMCINYEMDLWKSLRRYCNFEVSLSVVARSAYMADFAQEYARNTSKKEIALVVGDRHLTEVIYFLQNPHNISGLTIAAHKHAKIIAKHPGYYYVLFMVYLGFVGCGAFCAMIIYFILYAIYVLTFAGVQP